MCESVYESEKEPSIDLLLTEDRAAAEEEEEEEVLLLIDRVSDTMGIHSNKSQGDEPLTNVRGLLMICMENAFEARPATI